MQIIKAESTCLCCEGKTAWREIAQGPTEDGKYLVLQWIGNEENPPLILRIEYKDDSPAKPAA